MLALLEKCEKVCTIIAKLAVGVFLLFVVIATGGSFARDVLIEREYRLSVRSFGPFELTKDITETQKEAEVVESLMPSIEPEVPNAGVKMVNRDNWSFVGTYRNSIFEDRTFDGLPSPQSVSDLPTTLKDKELTAVTDVWVRDNKPEFGVFSGWQMGEKLKVLKEGGKVKVSEVSLVPALGGGRHVWIKLDDG